MFAGVYWTLAKWAALLFGAVFAVWWLTSSIYDSIYDNGRRDERAQWQEKEAKETAARLDKVKELEKSITLVEDDHKKKMAAIETKHIQELEEVNVKKERDVAAAYAGINKLRWKPGTENGNGDRKSNATGTDTRGCDDKTASELPPKITADLYSIANDADRNTLQLKQCQDVVTAYQKAYKQLTEKETLSDEKIPKNIIPPEATN